VAGAWLWQWQELPFALRLGPVRAGDCESINACVGVIATATAEDEDEDTDDAVATAPATPRARHATVGAARHGEGGGVRRSSGGTCVCYADR